MNERSRSSSAEEAAPLSGASESAAVGGSAAQASHAVQRQAFLRRLRPLTAHCTSNRATARGLFETILVGWTQRNFPGVTCEGFTFVERLSRRTDVGAFGDWLDSLGFLEASYWLSSAYAIWAGEEHRRRYAVFFTPPSLTRRLLDELSAAGIRFGESSFIDPACGGAAFLAPIAQRIREELLARGKSAAEVLAHVVDHLYGTDIDERLCALSRHFLRIVLREEIALIGRDPQFRVSRADSLSELHPLAGRFDVVVSNPPYRKMSAAELASVSGGLEAVVQSQPNLYGLFIALCLKLLRAGGKAALVSPTSFLTGQNFSRLRSFIADEGVVRQIGMVSHRKGVFIDVEQETALSIICRKPCPHTIPDTSISVVARDGSYQAVGSCQLSSDGSAWLIPRASNDLALLRRAQAMPHRLEHYGYLPRIGGFVWNRDQRPTYFDEEVPRERPPSLVPLLWASDIGADGRLRFGKKTRAEVEPNWVDFGSFHAPAVVKRPAVILQRVTSNDQPRRLVAAAVTASYIKANRGFVAENHVVVLEASPRAQVPPAVMVKLLSTRVLDRIFRCISGSPNVSAYELSQLPLPAPALIIKAAQSDELERVVSAAYGVTSAQLPS